MEYLYPALPIAGTLAWFSVFGAYALRRKAEDHPREMWGAATLSLGPACLFWLIIASGESSMLSRTFLIAPAGALFGACLFAWAGYVIHDLRAAPVLPDPPGPIVPPSPQSSAPGGVRTGGVHGNHFIVGNISNNGVGILMDGDVSNNVWEIEKMTGNGVGIAVANPPSKTPQK